MLKGNKFDVPWPLITGKSSKQSDKNLQRKQFENDHPVVF